MKTKTMRDIPTYRSLAARGLPRDRKQMVTELARLEHEKTRLEQERDTWLANQRRTEARLQQVEARRALLQAALHPEPLPVPAVTRPAQQPAASQSELPADPWSELSIEY